MWAILASLFGCMLVIAMVVSCYILFILRTTSNVKVRKLNRYLKDPAIIMTVEIAKARAAFNIS
jgi:uncharacterized iron-regulated membrane protein